MSNFLLKKPDCVLIHIPKTGGTSIRKGVWEGRYEGPIFGKIPNEWDDLFKFAFVRHPFDRFLSAYRMFTQGAITNDKVSKLPKDAYNLSLEQFANIVIDESIIYDERRSTFEEKIRHHTIPQTHKFNCLDRADFIGRYENLDADYAHISQYIGAPGTLPKFHYTNAKCNDVHLLPVVFDKLYKFYRQDFEKLGYDPELYL